jgi:hypothetical protein
MNIELQKSVPCSKSAHQAESDTRAGINSQGNVIRIIVLRKTSYPCHTIRQSGATRSFVRVNESEGEIE